MHPLEEKIGYKFRNSLLLAEALTHSSLGHETQKVHFDNQRLEYLGDAVLQLVSGEHLFRLFPDVDEGHLSKFRSRLVSGRALAQYAGRLGLGEHLMMGRGDENNGGRRRASTLADAFESLVGALYLDGGLEVAQAFVLAQASEHLDSLYEEPSVEINPKGHLQEILQALPIRPASELPRNPTYRILEQAGPDHARTFTAQVDWNGTALGRGQGASKQLAESAAALDALRFHRWAPASPPPPSAG